MFWGWPTFRRLFWKVPHLGCLKAGAAARAAGPVVPNVLCVGHGRAGDKVRGQCVGAKWGTWWRGSAGRAAGDHGEIGDGGDSGAE
jgi:hypothetical protein